MIPIMLMLKQSFKILKLPKEISEKKRKRSLEICFQNQEFTQMSQKNNKHQKLNNLYLNFKINKSERCISLI